VRRLLVALGLATSVSGLVFARWQSTPTACDHAQEALCTLTWRCELAEDVVDMWDEPTCARVVEAVGTAERSGSWGDTLCAALEHVPSGAVRAQLTPPHAAQVDRWQAAQCWWR
jgi:hypothetical protein